MEVSTQGTLNALLKFNFETWPWLLGFQAKSLETEPHSPHSLKLPYQFSMPGLQCGQLVSLSGVA